MTFYLNNFASLIIKETIRTIIISDADCRDEWDYAERDLPKIIKQHFGVK